MQQLGEEEMRRVQALGKAVEVAPPKSLPVCDWDSWYIGRAQQFERYIERGF